MSYTIEPIFVVFPLVCLFLSFVGAGDGKIVRFLITMVFILIYSFSLNGSDFDGYRTLYDMVQEGSHANQIHGEIGYYFLMKLSTVLKLDYIAFRIILLSSCSIVLFFSISKMSDDFALSTFFVSSMFVVYTISAYRQYVVIAFSIFWIYQYEQGRKWKAIIGLFSLMFFHATAVLPLIMVLYHAFASNRVKANQIHLFSRHYLLTIWVAIAFRFIIGFLIHFGPIEVFVNKILGTHATANVTLFSFGLVSRVAFLMIISFLYHHTEEQRVYTKILYWYYSVSILLYILIPMEFVMGRLVNNASILLAILIPALCYEHAWEKSIPGVIRISRITPIKICSVLFAVVILLNQLTHQDGYSPYLNVLRGDEPVVFDQHIEK